MYVKMFVKFEFSVSQDYMISVDAQIFFSYLEQSVLRFGFGYRSELLAVVAILNGVDSKS